MNTELKLGSVIGFSRFKRSDFRALATISLSNGINSFFLSLLPRNVVSSIFGIIDIRGGLIILNALPPVILLLLNFRYG